MRTRGGGGGGGGAQPITFLNSLKSLSSVLGDLLPCQALYNDLPFALYYCVLSLGRMYGINYKLITNYLGSPVLWQSETFLLVCSDLRGYVEISGGLPPELPPANSF
jgi:hypothetical protein